MPLVGIPCAQAVQEASRVTQRRRAPLDLLQESKHKTKLKCPRCSFTLHQTNLPPLLTNCIICPPRSQENTCEAHPEWNHRGGTTSEWHQWNREVQGSAEPRLEQNKGKTLPNIPSTHRGRFPIKSLQRHLAGKSWGCPGSLHVGISWGLPSSESVTPNYPALTSGVWSRFTFAPWVTHVQIPAQATNTSAPSGLPWGFGVFWSAKHTRLQAQLPLRGIWWKSFNNFKSIREELPRQFWKNQNTTGSDSRHQKQEGSYSLKKLCNLQEWQGRWGFCQNKGNREVPSMELQVNTTKNGGEAPLVCPNSLISSHRGKKWPGLHLPLSPPACWEEGSWHTSPPRLPRHNQTLKAVIKNSSWSQNWKSCSTCEIGNTHYLKNFPAC